MIAHFSNNGCLVYGRLVRVEHCGDLTKVWTTDTSIHQHGSWSHSYMSEGWMFLRTYVEMEDPE